MQENSRWIWGVVLVGLGVVFLLENLGLGLGSGLWGAIFAGAGLAFLFVYWQDRTRWWPLIPGFVLLALGITVWVGAQSENLGGALFLGLIGLGFLAVYAVNRSNWWAIIPGGTMLTLALVAGSEKPGREGGGFLFFLGLAATFGALYLIGQRWAVWPALGLLLLSVVTLEPFGRVFGFIWPLLLMAGGAWLLLRSRERVESSALPTALMPKEGSSSSVQSAAQPPTQSGSGETLRKEPGEASLPQDGGETSLPSDKEKPR
ncbi:MAG TPA: hypothetical protein VFS50_08600 [Meiothermus sp.]|jgi:hypothetical protein|nr:hypothetical protein [Meiothermus sp.]